MLLRGLTTLVLFQLLGSMLSALLLPMLPGAILGMLLLFVFLMLRREVEAELPPRSSGADRPRSRPPRTRPPRRRR